MRLLNTKTLELEDSPGEPPPRYAILSHTWGDDEVVYEDMRSPVRPGIESKAGWSKITGACATARRDNHPYIWIDTCCIDKSSSAELSEAINSMFKWYEKATVCYAYLEDVQPTREWTPSLRKCRWFTRGWTLQELLAPKVVELFAANWSLIGKKNKMSKEISDVTGIEEKFLLGTSPMSSASIAKRMSWASKRQTSRKEDTAYSLLGIFGVNMPLLYGEGEKAFRRLQEEIMKISHDQSLFAWGEQFRQEDSSDEESSDGESSSDEEFAFGFLADSPAAFQNSGSIVPYPSWQPKKATSISSLGLQVEVELSLPDGPLRPVSWADKFAYAKGSAQSVRGAAAAALACHYEDNFRDVLVVYLSKIKNSFFRVGSRMPARIARPDWVRASPTRTIISVVEETSSDITWNLRYFQLRVCPLSPPTMVMDCIKIGGDPAELVQRELIQNTNKFISKEKSLPYVWSGDFGLKRAGSNGRFEHVLNLHANFREEEVRLRLWKGGIDAVETSPQSDAERLISIKQPTQSCFVGNDTFDFTLHTSKAERSLALDIDIWSEDDLKVAEILTIRRSRLRIFENGSLPE